MEGINMVLHGMTTPTWLWGLGSTISGWVGWVFKWMTAFGRCKDIMMFLVALFCTC